MISAYFAGLRARLSPPVRVALAVVAAAICAAIAWFGASVPVEGPLLVVIALAAAALGTPAGVFVAVVAAVMDYVVKTPHGDAVIPAAIVLGGGIVICILFWGDMVPVEELGEGSGQLAFRNGSRVALPRGENGSVTSSTSIAALASGIREVSQGDFTKNIAVSDVALQELAIALNKLIFGMREFLGQLHSNATHLGGAGGDLRTTASTALAVIEGAAVAQGQLDEGIQEQARIV